MAKKKKTNPIDLWNMLIDSTLDGTLSWKLTIQNKEGYYCVCSTDAFPKVTFRWEEKGIYTLYWPDHSSVDAKLGSKLESAIHEKNPSWRLKGTSNSDAKKNVKKPGNRQLCKPIDSEMEQRIIQKMGSMAIKWTRKTKGSDYVIYETAEHSDHKYYLSKVTKNGDLDFRFEYDDVEYRVTKTQGAAMEQAILKRGFTSLDEKPKMESSAGNIKKELSIKTKDKKNRPALSQDLENELLDKQTNLYGRETCLMEVYTRPHDYEKLLSHGKVSNAAKKYLSNHKEVIFRIAEHEHSWTNRYMLYRRLVQGTYMPEEKESINPEEKIDSSSSENVGSALPQKMVEPKDFVILSSINRCVHRGHRIIDVVAVIKSFTKEYQTLDVEVSAGYCEACKLFFIQASEYDRLKVYGHPICPIILRSKYESSPETYENSFAELRQYSPLSLCGYSVSATEGLSATVRHKILAGMIDNDIMSKQGIINYLASFINRNGRIKSNRLAVAKWEEDIKFIEDYKKKNYTQVQVRRIKARR